MWQFSLILVVAIALRHCPSIIAASTLLDSELIEKREKKLAPLLVNIAAAYAQPWPESWEWLTNVEHDWEAKITTFARQKLWSALFATTANGNANVGGNQQLMALEQFHDIFGSNLAAEQVFRELKAWWRQQRTHAELVNAIRGSPNRKMLQKYRRRVKLEYMHTTTPKYALADSAEILGVKDMGKEFREKNAKKFKFVAARATFQMACGNDELDLVERCIELEYELVRKLVRNANYYHSFFTATPSLAFVREKFQLNENQLAIRVVDADAAVWDEEVAVRSWHIVQWGKKEAADAKRDGGHVVSALNHYCSVEIGGSEARNKFPIDLARKECQDGGIVPPTADAPSTHWISVEIHYDAVAKGSRLVDDYEARRKGMQPPKRTVLIVDAWKWVNASFLRALIHGNGDARFVIVAHRCADHSARRTDSAQMKLCTLEVDENAWAE